MEGAILNQSIPLRWLLGELEPSECKLHCAVWNGEDHPVDVIARSWEAWTDWNRWRGEKNDFNRRFIFSMAQSHDSPFVWLFGGVFEVTARRPKPHALSYDVEHRVDLLPGFTRRLKIGFRRPSGRNVRLRFESYVDAMQVAEVL